MFILFYLGTVFIKILCSIIYNYFNIIQYYINVNIPSNTPIIERTPRQVDSSNAFIIGIIILHLI